MIVKNYYVKNQFILWDDDGNEYFQSYDSIIAKKDSQGHISLDKTYWNYSQTTGKYRNRFLGENKAETEKKIASGIYDLCNLNYGVF